MPLTLEEFKKRVEATKVECLLCKKRFYALAGHLAQDHQLTVGQYRNKFVDAPVTSIMVKELIKQKPRVRYTDANVLDEIWGSIQEWGAVELAALGAKYPHKHPDLVPERNPNYFFPKREAMVVAMAVTNGMNLFVSGPTECGKTSLIEQVHAAMKRPLLRCNTTGDMTVKEFRGQMLLDPQKGTFFKEGVLPTAMRSGCSLLVDEVDFMPAHIAAILHPPLERNRTLYIPELGQTVKAESGFTIITTANTGGKGDRTGVYTGTEVLNTAFLDRFQMRLEMDYLPVDKEETMLTEKFPKLQPSMIKETVTFAREIREAFRQGNLEVTLGARKIEDYLQLVGMVGQEDAYRLVIADWLSDDEKGIANEIKARCFTPVTPPLR